MNNQSAFILNLPSEIIIDILSRCPTRNIIACKCVCKKFIKLISTPEFANSHLLNSTPGLIVFLSQRGESACTLYEFEDTLGLPHHDLHYNLVMKFDPNNLSSSPRANIGIECSYNGLLCLRESETGHTQYVCNPITRETGLDTLYVCNPITREYIPLPVLEGNVRGSSIVTYGIGMTALSGQFKVVRIYHELVEKSKDLKIECKVYTLGTGSWRCVEANDQIYHYSVGPPNGAFLNGNLHWLVEDEEGPQAISCFDLETELFKPFPPPPTATFQLMTTVGEYLCLCDYGSDEEILIWMMKEYGVAESWTKEFVIGMYPEPEWIDAETFMVLKVFRDGDILMLRENSSVFYYCKETGANQEVNVFGRDQYGWIDALIHTPSFLSLRSFERENVSLF